MLGSSLWTVPGPVGMILAVLLLAATWQVGAGISLGSEPPSGLSTAPSSQADNQAAPGVPMVMSPFYVFREQGSRVWLERIQIFFAGPEEGKIRRELELPQLRSAVYEALQAEPADTALEERLRNELSRMLGPETGRRVGLSRCYLLVP